MNESVEHAVVQWPVPMGLIDTTPPKGLLVAWRKIIRSEDYMLRWGIRTRWLTIYLHRYAGGDTGETPHNHPWTWWASMVLRGDVTERRQYPGYSPHVITRTWRSGISIMRGEYYHQIESTKPGTLTLFIAGPWCRHWGFQQGWNLNWDDDNE